MSTLLYISKRNRQRNLRGFDSAFLKEGYRFSHLSLEDYNYNPSDVLTHIGKISPDVILVHHNRGLMDQLFWKKLALRSYMIWWMNDERFPPDPWLLNLKPYFNLLIVSSYDTAEYLQKHKIDSEYLIMGFHPRPHLGLPRTIGMCFTGQNSTRFPLSSFRSKLITDVKANIGDNFKIYGKGWGKISTGIYIPGSIYHEVKVGLAVGHYSTRGTYSNRILTIMSHGALCMCHRGPGLDQIFTDHKHLVFYNNTKELLTLYAEYSTDYEKWLSVSVSGRKFIEDNLTWEHKALRIINMLRSRKVLP